MKSIFFDVDETLAMWIEPTHERAEEAIANSEGDLFFPHLRHIELLKSHKKSGDKVIVWTQFGEGHANEVVRLLKLESFVDLCLGKPDLYYDDLECSEWLTNWKYVKNDL